jgi:hypothetical protein
MDDPSDPPPSADGGSGGEGAGSRPVPRLGDFFWLGTACAVSVVAGGAIGYALDSWLHTTPWLSFGGLAFGIVSAVMLAVKQVRKFS